MTNEREPDHRGANSGVSDSRTLFDRLAYHNRATDFLHRAVRQDMLDHAYLFICAPG